MPPERSSTRELLNPLALAFRATTNWDPVEAEERALWNDQIARCAEPLRVVVRRLRERERHMVQQLIEGTHPERESKRRRSGRPDSDEGRSEVIAKLGAQLDELTAHQPRPD
jgi:hypothetical protein